MRSPRTKPRLTRPQTPQVFEDGNQRSAFHTRDPYQAALYSNKRTNSANPASATARARRRLAVMPLTFNVSTAMADLDLANLVVVLCRKSVCRFATCRCSRATRTRALSRFFDSRWQRASFRLARANPRCAAASGCPRRRAGCARPGRQLFPETGERRVSEKPAYGNCVTLAGERALPRQLLRHIRFGRRARKSGQTVRCQQGFHGVGRE